ncbi:Magnesium-transporting ATPase, P-type 1 [compost metagenome]
MDPRFWMLPLQTLEAEVKSDARGLRSDDATRRLPRREASRAAFPFMSVAWAFLRDLVNPLVLILMVAAGFSFAFGESVNGLLIIGIVLASLLLNLVQTFRSERAAEALKRLVATRARVFRDGTLVTIPLAEIVPGDVFLLSAGDIVPADGRLLSSKNLYVDQASLTGESFPAEKEAEDLSRDVGLDEARNSVFAGCSVVSGTGRAIAVRVGDATEMGQVAAALKRPPPPTEFERGVRAFSWLILRVTVLLVLFVFLVLALYKHRPLEAFLFAIALAVGLTPEFLPMIMAVTLSRGALRMAKQRVIVKQLQAIENFGSIDVLCSDKTGTLTEGRLTLLRAIDTEGAEDPRVLEAASLNSTFQTGIQSPLDQAILAAHVPRTQGLALHDEVPFDFHRRRLSVVLAMPEGLRMIVKGAPEAVMEVSSHVRRGDRELSLDEAGRACIHETFHRLSTEGLRLIAVAIRDVAPQSAFEVQDERDLTFWGFVVFRDSPKADAPEALRRLQADGIRVVILTGDNQWSTRQVCVSVGLEVGEILSGRDLDEIRDEALPQVVERVSVFVRLTPEQKGRVIRALKQRGHVIGYLGDGINDAPSLRLADVGISVDTAADVAREAAPIILLDKSLKVLHAGVIEGRRSFANVIKYILMGTSSNFGNMLSMAASALVLPFLPLLPTQILLNNLLYDASQVTLPGDRVDRDALRAPGRWNIHQVQRFMIHMGPVSSCFDFLTFGILLGAFNATPTLFRTAWFVESLLTQTLVIFIIRTAGNPLRSRPSTPLVLSISLVCLVALLLPFTPLAPWLGFVPLPIPVIGAIVGITAAYLLIVEVVKRYLLRRG